MSGGRACPQRTHRGSWRVAVRKANYSAFSGYRRTPSDYSEVACLACRSRWRTKAAYVNALPSLAREEA